MSESREVEKQQTPPPKLNELNDPPKTSPSPDAGDSELKLSRKREREVSLEPATPSTSSDADALVRARKDSRTPLKKNRRRLDPTQEEEDGGSGSRSRSGSDSPPSNTTSPRQVMKIRVRQISQGVEDISWKTITAANSQKDGDIDIQDDIVEENDKDVVGLAPDLPIITKDSIVDDGESPPETPNDTQLSQSVPDMKKADAAMQDSEETIIRLRAGSESNEKGLKRKFLERGTSQGPPEENGDASQPASETLKRPRDESTKDTNPREAKRPSPPPPSPPRPSPPSPKIPRATGFMAYASTSSPFASVKGQNIFSNKLSPLPSPFGVASSPSTTPLADFTSTFGKPSNKATPTVAKRTGFEAFQSSASPFAAVRLKSPVLGSTSKLGKSKSPPRRTNSGPTSNPFGSYAGPAQSFIAPAPKRARAASPGGSSRGSLERYPTTSVFGSSWGSGSGNGSDSGPEDERDDQPSSFSERLRAGKDDDDDNKSDEDQGKVRLTEQNVMTGEEEEETIHQARGKLFCLDDNQWKERGTGILKLNVKRYDGSGARLVMRKDAVYTLLLNITLFPGMHCTQTQDPRYLRFSAIENGAIVTYNLKVATAKIAQDLFDEIQANIPGPVSE